MKSINIFARSRKTFCDVSRKTFCDTCVVHVKKESAGIRLLRMRGTDLVLTSTDLLYTVIGTDNSSFARSRKTFCEMSQNTIARSRKTFCDTCVVHVKKESAGICLLRMRGTDLVGWTDLVLTSTDLLYTVIGTDNSSFARSFFFGNFFFFHVPSGAPYIHTA